MEQCCNQHYGQTGRRSFKILENLIEEIFNENFTFTDFVVDVRGAIVFDMIADKSLSAKEMTRPIASLSEIQLSEALEKVMVQYSKIVKTNASSP